nr:type II toxin-antitoxin system HicA family toxin [Enterococcus faecium]
MLKSNGFKKTGQTGSHAKFYNSKTKRNGRCSDPQW